MNKEQAILKMKEGKRITHTSFTPSEWMTIINGKVLFEDGNKTTELEFFSYRIDFVWNDGYSIWEQ